MRIGTSYPDPGLAIRIADISFRIATANPAVGVELAMIAAGLIGAGDLPESLSKWSLIQEQVATHGHDPMEAAVDWVRWMASEQELVSTN